MTLGNTPPHPLKQRIHEIAVANCNKGEIPVEAFNSIRNQECLRNYLRKNKFLELLNVTGTNVTAYLASADWRKEYIKERV